ncbi:MAG TPA: carboxypeptidase-like regulatory domain-containing protein [Bacteroidales bacterium]|nr:carboxypeptidase-like regulatory domain-containing protein [Bacteroidales bacterium]
MSRLFTFVFLFFPLLIYGQDLLDKDIVLQVKDMPVRNVLDQISESNNIFFTYAGNLKIMDKRISLNIDKVPLRKLLTDIFYGEDLVFSAYSNQVILKKKPEAVKVYPIKGSVLSAANEEPVAFASVQLRNSRRGTVAAIDGKFEITASAAEMDDSVSFYCIGYDTRTISVKSLSSLGLYNIFLTPRSVELKTVEHTTKKAQVHKEGNRGVATGSLYLDTHGQQVALFIENKKKLKGRIKTVSYYLSGKGNTEAPFRIRIYGVNAERNCPGEELLPDIVVVKPQVRRGWCRIDLSKYNIRFSEEGVFVAMEGIYPGDYITYLQSEKEASDEKSAENDDYPEGALEYGQRLGYNRFSRNDTWHYSLSHTWFQLDKKLFNVMISAEILVYDPEKSKKQKP